MENYSSNCYGFMRAGLLNTDDEFYLSRDEAFEGIKGIKKYSRSLNKVSEDLYETLEGISNSLSESEIENNQYGILEIFDGDKRSQHVAFIDKSGKFYDQDGPDGLIRLDENIEKLLEEYKNKLGGTAYYQVHILNEDLSTKIDNFLKDL